MTASTLKPTCRTWLPSLMLLGLMLGGCASQVSQASHLSGDLTAADNLCQQHAYKTKTDLSECYAANERPVIARDLPNFLYSYDAWRSAVLAASKDYDGKVTFANNKAWAVANVAQNDAGQRLSAAVAPFWPKDQKTDALLRDKLNSAKISACMRDGLFRSSSLVENSTCERNAYLPVIEKEVPATSQAYREYWGRILQTAVVFDQSMLPVTQKATDDFNQAIAPARAAYMSAVQAALQADAAATARQQQETADLLGVALAGCAAGYAAPAAPAPVFTNCTRVGNVVNCIGQ